MKLRMMNAALMIGAALLLTACSSGGDSPSGTPTGAASTTVSGTAAGGAPLVGTITVKDSKGIERPKNIDLAAGGAYSIDVTGLTPPFVLRADGAVGGQAVTYFSGTDSVITNGKINVNVTPFTSLIIGNIAGQIAANYYNAGDFSTLTTQALTDAQRQLRDRLLPLLQALGLNNTIDLLRDSFSANGTGIDAALDIVKVTVNPNSNTAILLNLINNQQIIDDLASKADVTQIDASGVTDFQQIAAGFKTLENLFATSIPAANNAQLLALFDTQNFLFDGGDFNFIASDFLLSAQNLGVKFSFSLVSMTPPGAPTNAKIMLTFSQENRIPIIVEWQLNKVTVNNVSTWRSIGNQRIAQADVQAAASNFQTVTTGLTLIGNFVPPGSTIDYAVVTGKGLTDKGGRDGQSEGLLLVNYRNGASMGVATPPYQGATAAQTPPRNQARFNEFPLTDQEILAFVDNELYTVIFYDDNDTPTNFSDDIPMNGSGYQSTLPKRPYLSSELPAAFPTITSPTLNELKTVALNGGNLTATWTLPVGLLANGLEFGRGTVPTGGGSPTFDFVDTELVTTAVTTSFTVGAPGIGQTVTSVHLSLHTQDSFGRGFQTFQASSIP
jgi:hypothetical protein